MTMDEQYILLVEDNSDDVALARRAFKKANLLNEIVVASDGAEALDFLYGEGAQKLKGKLPSLLLLDLKLPKIDGLEVLKEIRRNGRTRYLPVVILTSSNEERDLLEGYDLGANSYIRKPVDFNQFTDAVGRLGMYWLLLNKVPQGK